MIKVTSITAHTTPEGQRLSGTYSVIDEGGRLTRANEKYSIIVLEDEINAMISDITAWLLGRIPQDKEGPQ